MDARNRGKTLSIYLNVDQSLADNLNRGFETSVRSTLRAMEAAIENDERDRFRQSAALALDFLASYRPSALSLAVFVQGDGHLSSRELNVPIDHTIRWQERPYREPLVTAADEYEEVLIAVLDARHARLLTSFLGRVVEHAGIENPYPTAHTQAPGYDRQKSQTTFHRKSDEREKHYLKAVAKAIETLVHSHGLKRVVLAGNAISSKALYDFLPNEARTAVISFTTLPTHATLEDIGAAVAAAQERAERSQETTKVEHLLNRAGNAGKGVTGAAATLDALNAGRIHELVYAEGFALEGSSCENCGGLYSHPGACVKCASTLKPEPNMLDAIIGSALDAGAAIEQVRGTAAEQLRPVGAIGAFLRF